VKLNVTTPPELSFVIGLPPAVGSSKNSFESLSSNLNCLPYAVFGKFRSYEIKIDNNIIEVAVEQQNVDLSDMALLDWVAKAAQAITAYYGYFPIYHALVLIRGTEGDEIHGVTIGGGGASIVISLGEGVSEED